MAIKQFKNILNKDEQKYFKTQVLDNLYFPYYLSKRISVDTDSFPYFNHKILMRPEEVKEGTDRRNSPHYNYVANLFNIISKRFKFKYKNLLRISINLTFNSGVKECAIHKDHDYPHKQLLIFLHVDDKNSFTIFYDKDCKKIIKRIKPENNTGIMADNQPHNHLTPKKGYRVVLVYTFH